MIIHKPIKIKNLTLSFPHKACFKNFSYEIAFGSRIAIIGRNGSGKTSLLKMLSGATDSPSGSIEMPEDIVCGYVPQVIESNSDLSGGQRLNTSITESISLDPNVLLLDEPTNHLDSRNRKSLIRRLQSYRGTLIIVSHDTDLLRSCINTLWHINNGQINVFSGNYDDYMTELIKTRSSIEKKILQLNKQKKDTHKALMKEQNRAAKSKAKGKKSTLQKKWPGVVSAAKKRGAEEVAGQKKVFIDDKKQQLISQLSALALPSIIIPKFSLTNQEIGVRTILSVSDGSVGYKGREDLVKKINILIKSNDRIVIQGDNASGKSTLVKAMLNDNNVLKSGEWNLPKLSDIGYLDQHYDTLDPKLSVFENIKKIVPTWSFEEIKNHLNDFLFRKNEEVNILVEFLSGGEKARLSLAQIAAKVPKILVLDEITNNLDIETKQHVIEVLKNYPGAMILISHDADLLRSIRVDYWYKIIKEGGVIEISDGNDILNDKH